jgi:hypothetical protein
MARAMGSKKPISTTATEEKEEFLCYCCGETKKKDSFYISTDPFNSVGVNPFCKLCIQKIARNYNERTKQYGEVTKTSLCNALERADLPYLENIWESSYNEVHDPTLKQPKTNIWAAYAKNIKMKQYDGLRWKDGDIFKKDNQTTQVAEVVLENRDVNPEVMDELEKNRKDVIRLIGYDPFEKEAEDDKPLLYAQLIGYIDMSGDNEDTTRILDSIEIVRGYLQLQKLNDMSAKAFANLAKTGQSGEIKNYMDTKKKVADVISQLAEQSCISMKHNKNASKGENTFAGKIKKLKELNLREAELNAFDIGTCEGMRQVADISNASIIKQLHLDESDYTEMLAQQRDMIVKLQEQADKKTEEARILLRENLDLKSYIESKGIDISEYLSDETILYTE